MKNYMMIYHIYDVSKTIDDTLYIDHIVYLHYIYIHFKECALVFGVNLAPPWYGPPRPWARHNVPPVSYCQAACLPYSPLFPHLVKFLANTVQFNTTCKDYDSINQHSHQSTPTTGLQGGGGQTMTMPGRGGGGATLEHIYVRCFFLVLRYM